MLDSTNIGIDGGVGKIGAGKIMLCSFFGFGNTGLKKDRAFGARAFFG
jgi:hypothetical protein